MILSGDFKVIFVIFKKIL